MMIKKRDPNEKGFALVAVLIVVVVLSFLFLAIVNLTNNNAKQMDMQEDHMRAYYLSKSGIDIAYAALMMTDNNGVQNIRTIIDGKKEKLESILELPNAANPLGKVTIDVKMVNDEVRIAALAELENSDSTALLALYVHKDDFNKTHWERE
ncbi:hypothetical protein [Fusibacter ferrireducens]|uniref:Type 4 fimbrial biogenesis protein PilX N-terminal domain-containing protein n=1 Tax=Fusibacter ferrireducens TaxID=2785058 RepID=A0ABR9ZTN7_9FIRM|nr:hypothetical protein [Fusibacter ferrireducens]MBF4693849.1 hypothetical protein [Fusibacter ferrireducens]